MAAGGWALAEIGQDDDSGGKTLLHRAAQVGEPAMIKHFVANLLGEETTEESLNTATIIRYPRFEWRRASKPLRPSR